MDDKEHKYWDNFIRNLCDLNYIKPFRHLIHYILHWLKALQERIDEFGTYVTQEVFDALEKRVATNEDNIEDLQENKADKSDLEDLEGRVDDNESAIDDLEEDLGDLTDNVSDIEERVTTNENNITDLQNDKADKADVEEYEEKTDGRLDNLEECCEEVGEHLEQVDGRLDTDEDNIDTLLDNMIVLSDHNGIIATDNYFEDYLDINMDDLVREMAEKGIMKYEIYTSYYPERENWVSEIHDAVKEIYDYEWENNFAFIEVDNILFGGTSPRVMVKLIPRERDVYVCMCYHVGNIEEAFDGHCFLHRTPTEDLEERIEKCEERLDEHDEMLEALQEADKVFDERIGKLEECCDVVNETLDDFDKRITKAQGTADQADAKADHNAEDISHLEDDIADVRDHANKAVEEAGEAKDAAESAEESAKNAEEKAEEAAEKVDQFDDRITKNEEDIANLEECCEEVQETLEDQDSRIEANETAIDELKENKADKDEIPDEYLKSFHRIYSSDSQDNTEYTAMYATDQDDQNTYAYSGDMSGINVEKTENGDGSITYTLTPQFVGGSENATRTYGSYKIEVPAGYDDTEIRNMISDLQSRVSANETSISDIESEISDIQTAVNNAVSDVSVSHSTNLSTYGYRSTISQTKNGSTTEAGYVGDISDVTMEETENSDGSKNYELDQWFINGSGYGSAKIGDIEVPAEGAVVASKSQSSHTASFVKMKAIASTPSVQYGTYNFSVDSNGLQYYGTTFANVDSIIDEGEEYLFQRVEGATDDVFYIHGFHSVYKNNASDYSWNIYIDLEEDTLLIVMDAASIHRNASTGVDYLALISQNYNGSWEYTLSDYLEVDTFYNFI